MIENKSQIYYVSKQDGKIISDFFLSVTAKKTRFKLIHHKSHSLSPIKF